MNHVCSCKDLEEDYKELLNVLGQLSDFIPKYEINNAIAPLFKKAEIKYGINIKRNGNYFEVER